jgi:hypothetical protein
MAMVAEDFGGTPTWNNGLDEGRATIVEERGARFLRVTYPAGQFGPSDAGVQFVVPLAQGHDEVFLSYRVRFGEGFQFVKGGKLPGMVGGTRPTGCLKDLSEVEGGFSARMMWRRNGAVVQLMYTSALANLCGDDFPYTVGGRAGSFVPGEWQQVRHRLRMNTPGQSDGVVQAWLDGSLALDRHDVAFRGSAYNFLVDAIYFSTFFGGSDATWAPTSDQTVDYDDFVISLPSS